MGNFSTHGVRCRVRPLRLVCLPSVHLFFHPVISPYPCPSAHARVLALKKDAPGEGFGRKVGGGAGWGLLHASGEQEMAQD